MLNGRNGPVSVSDCDCGWEWFCELVYVCVCVCMCVLVLNQSRTCDFYVIPLAAAHSKWEILFVFADPLCCFIALRPASFWPLNHLTAVHFNGCWRIKVSPFATRWHTFANQFLCGPSSDIRRSFFGFTWGFRIGHVVNTLTRRSRKRLSCQGESSIPMAHSIVWFGNLSETILRRWTWSLFNGRQIHVPNRFVCVSTWRHSLWQLHDPSAQLSIKRCFALEKSENWLRCVQCVACNRPSDNASYHLQIPETGPFTHVWHNTQFDNFQSTIATSRLGHPSFQLRNSNQFVGSAIGSRFKMTNQDVPLIKSKFAKRNDRRSTFIIAFRD